MGLEKKLSKFRIFKMRKEAERIKKLKERMVNGLEEIYSPETQDISLNKNKNASSITIATNTLIYIEKTNYSGNSLDNKY